MRTSRVLTVLLLLASVSGCAAGVNSQSQGGATSKPLQTSPLSTPQTQGVKVGLLLPLSGQQASLGQSMLSAAQLALYDVGDDQFSLMPEDTKGDAAGAAAAAQKVMAQGAQIIIGPVFSPEVEAVKPIVTSSQIPLIALSNNETLAAPGVYVLGLSPADQVARVLSYAQQNGVTRVAALLPNTPYGDALAQAFAQRAPALGLTIVRQDRYVAGGDMGATARDFMAALNAAGGTQALLMGEAGSSLQALAVQLRINGFSSATIRPLGTALWEDGSAVASFGNGWYAAVAGSQRRAFMTRYQQTYGTPAPAIAPLAYDATALAAVLAKTPDKFSPQRLLDPMGFGGVDGIFRLEGNGNVERGLAVFEVTPQGNRVIDAAPINFAPVPVL